MARQADTWWARLTMKTHKVTLRPGHQTLKVDGILSQTSNLDRDLIRECSQDRALPCMIVLVLLQQIYTVHKVRLTTPGFPSHTPEEI
jgi:hypothetical protein